jgi:hypothetical protein
MGGEILKISISETTEPIGTKLCLNSPWVIPFQIVSDSPDLQPTWPPLIFKKKMHDEAQILYSSTNSISLK